jgi:KUP system potassium uptake protein
VPPALLHNLKHNKVLHQRVVVTTIAVAKIPHVTESDRLTIVAVGEGFFRVIIHYGFIDMVDVPADISRGNWEEPFKLVDTSFFLSRQTLIASDIPGMAIWREKLFAWMMRNAESAMDYFKLPTNRVVELGSQVEI